MVQYDNMDSAKEALVSVKGTFIKNSRRIMVSFDVVGIPPSPLLTFAKFAN